MFRPAKDVQRLGLEPPDSPVEVEQQQAPEPDIALSDGWFRRPNGEKYRPHPNARMGSRMEIDDEPIHRSRIRQVNNPFDDRWK
jgi:hypothetical protein